MKRTDWPGKYRSVLRMGWALGLGLSILSTLPAQTLIWLGSLSEYESRAYDVSADGTVVVGQSTNANGRWRAFRWTHAAGMQDLGTLGGEESEAYAVSWDGRVVVGRAQPANALYYRPFRWTVDTGAMEDLGTLSGLSGEAWGMSVDGSVVVGVAGNAFRWRADTGTMEDLGSIADPPRGGWAYDVSADGIVVVGWARNANNQLRAFRWTEETGMVELSAPEHRSGFAYAVSGDGRVAVGRAWTSAGAFRAFRWIWQDPPLPPIGEDLGTVGGLHAEARDISADGNVVVGWSRDANNRDAAFRWTAQTGMQNLNVVYANLLTYGSFLQRAEAVSLDGRYIAGWGFNGFADNFEGFLLDTWRFGDTNGDGCIDDADLLNVLFAFGTPGTGYTRHEDINKDGLVDDADLLIVLFNFGSGC